MKWVLITSLAGMALAFGLGAVPANAITTWVVDDDGAPGSAANCTAATHTTIQGAIDAASDNDRILVCPGDQPPLCGPV